MPGVQAFRVWCIVIIGRDMGGIFLYASGPGDTKSLKASDTLTLC